MTPQDVLPLYDRLGPAWAGLRDRTLFERHWLDRFLSLCPRGTGKRRILDLGCGAGRPIAAYLVDRGASVTGVDGSQPMIRLFQEAVPQARALHRDMRGLELGERFDGILLWDSFFHLPPEDQRPLFATLAAHAAPGAALLFTSGPAAGVAIGTLGGEPLYHASLDPGEYRALLADAGFGAVGFVPDDPACGGHSIWLARYRAQIGSGQTGGLRQECGDETLRQDRAGQTGAT